MKRGQRNAIPYWATLSAMYYEEFNTYYEELNMGLVLHGLSGQGGLYRSYPVKRVVWRMRGQSIDLQTSLALVYGSCLMWYGVRDTGQEGRPQARGDGGYDLYIITHLHQTEEILSPYTKRLKTFPLHQTGHLLLGPYIKQSLAPLRFVSYCIKFFVIQGT